MKKYETKDILILSNWKKNLFPQDDKIVCAEHLFEYIRGSLLKVNIHTIRESSEF